MSAFYNIARVTYLSIYELIRIQQNKGIHIMECKTLYCTSKKSLLIKYSMTLHVQEVLTILYYLQEYILCVQEVDFLVCKNAKKSNAHF